MYQPSEITTDLRSFSDQVGGQDAGTHQYGKQRLTETRFVAFPATEYDEVLSGPRELHQKLTDKVM
jgi:hypothetical protein